MALPNVNKDVEVNTPVMSTLKSSQNRWYPLGSMRFRFSEPTTSLVIPDEMLQYPLNHSSHRP